MRLSILYLGSTGAGPVYSLEMAKAVSALGTCKVQVVISKRVSNLNDWIEHFKNTDVVLDIVETYGHNSLDFAIGTIMFWRVNKIIKRISQFGPDYLYVPFLLTWDFLIYPRLSKKMRIVATLHDPHPHDEEKNRIARWIRNQNKKAYKYVSDVIILNKGDREYVKKNFCKNVYIIPHASFSYYVKDVTSDGRLKNTIGFLGRIEPYKGLDLLVNAFLKLDSKYQLLIAGSGPIDNDTYQKIVTNERIKLINRYIRDNEFSNLISRMDFVVLPYKRASQSGVIPLVFAHGKPVVVTNVGALEEQVPEGTGIVTNPDIESLTKCLLRFYEEPALIFDYGENARLYAETELTWEHSAKLLLDIIYNENCI